jgi:hypothetical protein
MAKEIAPGNLEWFVASVAVLKSAVYFTWTTGNKNFIFFLICLYTSFNVIQIIRAVYVIYENTLEEYILKSKLTVLHRRKDIQKGIRKYYILLSLR